MERLIVIRDCADPPNTMYHGARHRGRQPDLHRHYTAAYGGRLGQPGSGLVCEATPRASHSGELDSDDGCTGDGVSGSQHAGCARAGILAASRDWLGRALRDRLYRIVRHSPFRRDTAAALVKTGGVGGTAGERFVVVRDRLSGCECG